MATDLFTKLNNIFGDQQNYADLHEASVEKAKNLSQLIFNSLSNPSPSEFEPTHRVAIVGAGLAGLSAAYFLLQEGVNVTLFEAGDRSGGRVETDQNLVPGRLIEAGAELIGLNHPLWLTLARDLRLSLATVTPELHYVAAQLDIYVDLEEEAPREEDTVINARGLRLDQLRRLHGHMDAIYSKLNGLAEQVNAYRPWDAADAATLDQQSVSDWVQRLIMPDIPEADLSLAKQAILNELENDQCVSPNNQSLLGLLAAVAGGSLSELKEDRPSEYWTHSEVFRCADGNHMLAMKLLEACKEQYGDNFRYRQSVPVTKLALPQGFKQLFWGNGKGENEVFDWVVFAVPSPTIFNSEHAAPIELAGDHPPRCPQNGAAVKYLTHVQRRFWMDRPQDAFAPSAFSGLLGSFWESTDNQTTSGTGDDGGIGISLFSGSRFADTVVSYDQRNKLDTQIAEIFADFPANQADTKLLNWPERRFIGTGYSCPGIGELMANNDFFCRHHNGVIFAGEYTSAPLFGYMEGALQSGLRAAMLVMGRRVQSSPRFEGAASGSG